MICLLSIKFITINLTELDLCQTLASLHVLISMSGSRGWKVEKERQKCWGGPDAGLVGGSFRLAS